MRQPKIITTLRDYTGTLFLSDLIAGLTVAMVAIPLSIAIAIASGATPTQGLVTAIVGGLLISLLGGSRVQIGGPTGAFIVLVYTIIATHGYDGLVLATLLAGIILLVAGYFRAGNLIAYVPYSVVSGFTIGIAIIIATSQIKDLFGLSIAKLPADFFSKIGVLWDSRESFSPDALIVAFLSLLLIMTLHKLGPRLPGLIIAVAAVSMLVAFGILDTETITSRYGPLPNQLPAPHLPAISLASIIELIPSSVAIAFLAGIESLLSALVADQMIDGHHRPNAELTAQGFANIASALFGGMPATGAIARTATNVRAGGKTPVAGVIHALTILVVMMLAAPLAGYLAMPALAALLLYTAWNMSEPKKWVIYARQPPTDIILLLITLFLTVAVDLSVAIGVGVLLGFILRYWRKDASTQH